MPLTWSASTEKLEVTQARVDKPDGRSIIMEPDAIREDPLTGDEYFHEFSDEHRLLITFTDVEPSDLIVDRAHRDVIKPRVPGGFTAAGVLDRSVGWEETNFTVSVPADMPFQYDTRGFDHESELIKDRMMHYFHSSKIGVPARQVAVLGEFDRLPRFVTSTFRNWDEFGKAYASVLLPHAKVTPAITAMAAKLTDGKPDKADQARTLYLWVRDNVRDVAIPLEESRPEPNDAELVMTKRYGDAKDHAVLLYALLAARGIPAELVLLNATNDATIADPPTIRPMNHLILYLPTLDVYLDATVAMAPFGKLPFGELGKPAIHLGGSGVARREIPIPPSGATHGRTEDRHHPWGGRTTSPARPRPPARGAFGIWLRTTARTFGENEPAAAVTILRQHGTPGTGTFSFDPPTTPGDDYTVNGTFRLANQSALLRGGFFTLWTGLRILPRPGRCSGGPDVPARPAETRGVILLSGNRQRGTQSHAARRPRTGGPAAGYRDRYRAGALPVALVGERAARHRHAGVSVPRRWARFARAGCVRIWRRCDEKFVPICSIPWAFRQDKLPEPGPDRCGKAVQPRAFPSSPIGCRAGFIKPPRRDGDAGARPTPATAGSAASRPTIASPTTDPDSASLRRAGPPT